MMTADAAFFAALMAAEFGDAFDDMRAELPANPDGPNGAFSRRAMDGVLYLAVHHTAGNASRPWADIARDHILPKSQGGRLGAAGIGYHVGIRRGRVAYLGDVELSRANVGRLNHLVIGVVVAGDYTREALAAADHDLLRRVVGVIDSFMGRRLEIRGHGALPGQATQCPGGAILAALPGLRGAAPATVPPRLESALQGRLRAAVAGRWLMGLNVQAGLQRAIRAAAFAPATEEWSEDVGGTVYVCQGALGVVAGRLARRVYYVVRGEWERVMYIDVPT